MRQARRLHEFRTYEKHTPRLPMTHDEIAKRVGVCRERVCQIERAALRKIREACIADAGLRAVVAEMFGVELSV